MAMKSKETQGERCMGMSMNKKKFIETLKDSTSYTEKECSLINEILERHFFPTKKDEVLKEWMKELNIEKDEAEKLWQIVSSILKSEIKNKLKHPFGSQNKTK